METKTVIKGYKYRIYPTKEQEVQLAKTFGCCRFVYNKILAMKIDLYKNEGKSLSKTTCNNYCNRELKKEYSWLKEVDKFALTNSIYNLDEAYQNFFRRVKENNDKVGFPKFKSKHNHYYSYKTNFTNNNIKVLFKDNLVQLPKLGKIKAKLHREFEGRILYATISKVPSGKYYVSFNIECEHNILPKSNNKIGIDLGIKDLLITTDGEPIDNQKLTYKYEKKLAKLQRQLCKMQLHSNNYKKQTDKIAKLHEKISNKRIDNLHKISLRIIRENQFIFSEDLNIKGMVKNPNLSKSIHDCGWHELTRQLTYKGLWNDRTYHKVDRYFASSQLCSNCGYKNEEVRDLTLREWDCPICKAHHNRDINASKNILMQGLKDLNVGL
ncbi:MULTISPECIES: IS200/IS605 family element RNA-guided endonuclease TnpB [unclassified Clostridium]|uniref:IS200/IS605 family element RNA-guided endonuclease TnpB n=1 Tax=unclassified Clostridium TaxID=2614128 RepID=UPI0025C5137F|nr:MULTISPECIES: IS200/IS605 family element RNA-guided endonuclease TnpB [unclassified Clostridium]